MDYSYVSGAQPSAPSYNPAYQPEHRSSGLIRTIKMIAIVAFSLLAAAVVDYDAPPLALLLRIVAGGAALIWLIDVIRRPRHGGDYHQTYRSNSQPSHVDVVVVQEPPRGRSFWSGGFGFGNLFGFGSQPMYVATQNRHGQQSHHHSSHHGDYGHGVPLVARTPAQPYGGQTMHVAPETRGTPPPPVYQQSHQGGYSNGNGAPPVYRAAPAQQHGGQTMHVAPETRAPAASQYQQPVYHQGTTPAAYAAPPQNYGGNPGGQMRQAPADRNK